MSPATPARRGGDGRIRVRRGGVSREESARVGSSGQTARAEQTVSLGQLRIAEIQRTRILSAMLDTATELGAGHLSVADVVERSGVSRRTFYELFADREDCVYAAFEQALADASDRVLTAYLREKSWRERVRAGLVALLCFFDREPQAGRFLITESLAGGTRTVARRAEVIGRLTSVVEEGAAESKTTILPPALTGEGVVGGVLAVIQRRLVEESYTPLVELANPLMSMIVLPYLGAGAARRELERAIPTSALGAERALEDGGPVQSRGDAPHLQDGACPDGDSRAPWSLEPRDRRDRRDQRPGPDLKAARSSEARGHGRPTPGSVPARARRTHGR